MLYEDGEIQNKGMLIDDNVGRKILDSAFEIINREGYENLTIRKVAKESGCSNSAIYQRFGDKNALAGAVAALQAKPFLVIMDEAYSKEADLFTNLNKIMTKMLEKLYYFELEAIYMQTIYRGGLELDGNPFVLRIERCLKTAIARGEAKVANIRETAFLISASFWGFMQMIRANKNCDLEKAEKLLEAQNRMICNGISTVKGKDALWDLLREKGVHVDKALERMKGNREAYKSFLIEFFEDPDFEALGEEIKAGNAQKAFEYAHGLKGMAANLGLDDVQNQLSVLVEILRPGKIAGAMKAYDDVMEACSVVTDVVCKMGMEYIKGGNKK